MDEEGWQTVRPFIAAHNMNYRVALATDQVARRYGGIGSLPTTFIIDQEGRIAAVHIGLVSKTDYTSEILHLLANHEFAASIGPEARPNCKYAN
jgi:peroxiredoxin